VSYGDTANPKTVITGSKITLVFNTGSDQIAGNGGVNGYGGKVRFTNSQLAVTQIIRTEMASINQAINDQENTYFQMLQDSQSVEFGNNSLTIHCQGGQMLAFNPA
jgi:heat shock protein HslJ